jgi:intracellular septation protein
MNSNLRFVLDFSPLAGFFLAYRLAGLLAATATLIGLTVISLAVTYAYERRIATMPLVSGISVTLLGGLKMFLKDDYFIKIKPTLVNLLFAGILLGGLCCRKSLFKHVLGHAMQLTDEGWWKLSLRWGIYFIFLAGLNEVIWRNFPTDFWVDFKVFGMFSLTMLFTLIQIPLIKRCWVEPSSCAGAGASQD